MTKTRNSKNASSKKTNFKAHLKPSLKNPPSCIAQPSTPKKDIPMATISTPNNSEMKKMNAYNLKSPIVLDPLQTSNNNHSNPIATIHSPPINPTPILGKRSLSCIDPFATHVDVNSLAGYKK